MIDKKTNLRGFTIIEMLIAMILTSLSVTFSYSTFNYVQKLFIDFKKQNQFVSEWITLNQRLGIQFLNSRIVYKEEDKITFSGNSDVYMELGEKNTLLKKINLTDTFHFALKRIEVSFESVNNPAWSNKLLSSFHAETIFKGQKFAFSFNKEHDSVIKLELEEGNVRH